MPAPRARNGDDRVPEGTCHQELQALEAERHTSRVIEDGRFFMPREKVPPEDFLEMMVPVLSLK